MKIFIKAEGSLPLANPVYAVLVSLVSLLAFVADLSLRSNFADENIPRD